MRAYKVPMFAIAGALLGLILLLATLQYKWLGQISGAERERMTANLNTRAAAFGVDFDRELTYFHPNAVVTWHNAEVSRGRDGIRKYLGRMLEGPNKAVASFSARRT